MNNNFNYNEPQKNKNTIVFIMIAIIICICVFVYFKFIKSDVAQTNNNINVKQVEDNTLVNTNNINTTYNNTNNINNTNSSNNSSISSDSTVTYDSNGEFLMAIEDVFTITGRGTVVTGRIERGTINLNDTVQIIGLNNNIKTTDVTGIEMFRKNLDTATAGDNVGLLLKDIERSDVERGQVVAKPNSIGNVTKFSAQVYVLTKDEGGRHTPFFNGYRPQFYFRTTDVTGVVELPSNIEMVSPGDNVTMRVELVSPMAIEKGTEFSIREGGRTIGKGTVTEIY